MYFYLYGCGVASNHKKYQTGIFTFIYIIEMAMLMAWPRVILPFMCHYFCQSLPFNGKVAIVLRNRWKPPRRYSSVSWNRYCIPVDSLNTVMFTDERFSRTKIGAFSHEFLFSHFLWKALTVLSIISSKMKLVNQEFSNNIIIKFFMYKIIIGKYMNTLSYLTAVTLAGITT